jgi:hypothetical protein
MSTPEVSDLFADPGEDRRRIEVHIVQLQEEAKTATPERRTQIGWFIFGALKHCGRLADVNVARRFGEHRFIIHETSKGHTWAVCSCRARFPGRMHVNFTLEEFPHLPGHRSFPLSDGATPTDESETA